MENKLRAPAVELRHLGKKFGTCVANHDVTLKVEAGSIHAVVGENGAGKSTAMKMLYGQYAPDTGEILVDGVRRQWRSSADAIAAGLGMVHQHFMLAGRHDAVENVLLAAGGHALQRLDRHAARSRLASLMGEFRMEVRLNVPVDQLSVGEQQRLEILKLLYRDSRILILDEPTAVLAPTEIESLFTTLRGMAARGKTVILITHKLKEVVAFADRVTVLRAGSVTGERSLQGVTVAELASLMVGREVRLGEMENRSAPREAKVLELRNAQPCRELSRLGAVSFVLHAGEILGVAGVEGNGQSELIQLLLDPAERLEKGEIFLHGKSVARRTGAELRAAGGFAVFPEDRLREALLLEGSLEDNFLLGHQRAGVYRRAGVFLDRARLRQETEKALRDFEVRPPDPDARAGSLSGGNQQKLVVARELSAHPRFLLAAQPTRGVDVGAIESIHARLLSLRAEGAGILLFSAELDELLKLADRLLVLFRGHVVGSFARADFDEKKIGLLMAGGGER